MPDFIIIGAGISGLTCAYALKKAGKSVLLFEGSSHAGGKIGTDRVDGYLLESGPNSLRLENRETQTLLRELGLLDRMIEASPNAKKRFILRNGAWRMVPRQPLEAISTGLLSLAGKLRALQEPFVKSSLQGDETIADFFTRHFGKEVFEYAADPFVTGIYAGDPQKLSVRHSFPQLWQLDKKYGSVLKGGLKNRRAPKDPHRIKPSIISFPDGLGEITHRLCEELKNELILDEEALTLAKSSEGFTLTTTNQQISASHLVLAMPAYSVGKLVSSLAPPLSALLHAIEYPSVGIAYLGYRNDQFAQPIEGFGGLIPGKENRKILGIIYSSSNFPGRAPDGHTLLTVLLGGARNSAIAHMSEKEITDIAASEVSALLSPKGAPVFRKARLWKRAIPQYNVGYAKVLTALEETEQEFPGLHFLGNYRGGISVGACIRNATELARCLV